MLAIKLKLVGKKHQRMFRVIVAEKKSKLQGRFVDDLGFWNPHTKKFSLNKEKTNKWLKEGVRPTDTAYNLLVKAGVIKGKKVAVHKKSEKPPEDKTEEALANEIIQEAPVGVDESGVIEQEPKTPEGDRQEVVSPEKEETNGQNN